MALHTHIYIYIYIYIYISETQCYPINMIMNIMSMGWDLCLRTAAISGPIVHLRVTFERGELWWWWRRLGKASAWLVHQSSMSATIRHLVAKQEELAKEIINLALRISIHTSKGSLHITQTYDMVLTALRSLRRKARCRFLSPLQIPSPSAFFEPANLGSNDKYASHKPPRTNYRTVTLTGK
jgi:hypothetical protein